MGDFTPQIATSASVAMLALVIGAMFRLLVLQRRRDAEYEAMLTEERRQKGEVEADLRWCGSQRNRLVTLCQRKGHGDEISFVWEQRPATPTQKAATADDAG